MQLVGHSKRMKSLRSVMGRVLSTNGNEWFSRSALTSTVFRANEQLQSNCSSVLGQMANPSTTLTNQQHIKLVIAHKVLN